VPDEFASLDNHGRVDMVVPSIEFLSLPGAGLE